MIILINVTRIVEMNLLSELSYHSHFLRKQLLIFRKEKGEKSSDWHSFETLRTYFGTNRRKEIVFGDISDKASVSQKMTINDRTEM